MTGDPYARRLTGMGFLILVALVVVAVMAWKMRVRLLAKVLGQSEARVQRQLDARKRR